MYKISHELIQDVKNISYEKERNALKNLLDILIFYKKKLETDIINFNALNDDYKLIKESLNLKFLPSLSSLTKNDITKIENSIDKITRLETKINLTKKIIEIKKNIDFIKQFENIKNIDLKIFDLLKEKEINYDNFIDFYSFLEKIKNLTKFNYFHLINIQDISILQTFINKFNYNLFLYSLKTYDNFIIPANISLNISEVYEHEISGDLKRGLSVYLPSIAKTILTSYHSEFEQELKKWIINELKAKIIANKPSTSVNPIIKNFLTTAYKTIFNDENLELGKDFQDIVKKIKDSYLKIFIEVNKEKFTKKEIFAIQSIIASDIKFSEKLEKIQKILNDMHPLKKEIENFLNQKIYNLCKEYIIKKTNFINEEYEKLLNEYQSDDSFKDDPLVHLVHKLELDRDLNEKELELYIYPTIKHLTYNHNNFTKKINKLIEESEKETKTKALKDKTKPIQPDRATDTIANIEYMKKLQELASRIVASKLSSWELRGDTYGYRITEDKDEEEDLMKKYMDKTKSLKVEFGKYLNIAFIKDLLQKHSTSKIDKLTQSAIRKIITEDNEWKDEYQSIKLPEKLKLLTEYINSELDFLNNKRNKFKIRYKSLFETENLDLNHKIDILENIETRLENLVRTKEEKISFYTNPRFIKIYSTITKEIPKANQIIEELNTVLKYKNLIDNEHELKEIEKYEEKAQKIYKKIIDNINNISTSMKKSIEYEIEIFNFKKLDDYFNYVKNVLKTIKNNYKEETKEKYVQIGILTHPVYKTSNKIYVNYTKEIKLGDIISFDKKDNYEIINIDKEQLIVKPSVLKTIKTSSPVYLLKTYTSTLKDFIQKNNIHLPDKIIEELNKYESIDDGAIAYILDELKQYFTTLTDVYSTVKKFNFAKKIKDKFSGMKDYCKYLFDNLIYYYEQGIDFNHPEELKKYLKVLEDYYKKTDK